MSALASAQTLLKLDISSNNLHAEGGKALAEALENNHTMTELCISSNNLHWNGSMFDDTSGIIALTKAAKGMMALESWDISDNKVPTDGDGTHYLAEALGLLEKRRTKKEWAVKRAET